MNALIESFVPTHTPFTAKHPVVIFHPTFDVEVAWPIILNPESVVVPKPKDDTESCVAVDEPMTNEGPVIPFGLIESMANGVVVPSPNLLFVLSQKNADVVDA